MYAFCALIDPHSFRRLVRARELLAHDDRPADYARLQKAGVAFTEPPTDAGPVKSAVLSDTVGNLVQRHQKR